MEPEKKTCEKEIHLPNLNFGDSMLVLGFWGCKYIPGGAVFISCKVFRFILAMGTGIDTGQIHFKNFVQ